jgi:hypothetical protein
MSTHHSVQPGDWYLVEIERTWFRVKSVEQPPELPGWWICETASGERLALPETSLQERCPPAPPA